MNTLHRIVGTLNLLFFFLLVVVIPSLLSVLTTLIGGAGLIAVVGVLFLVSTVWGVRNAFYYWRSKVRLHLVDHLFLVAGLLNALMLCLALGLFIYLGEN